MTPLITVELHHHIRGEGGWEICLKTITVLALQSGHASDTDTEIHL